MELFIWLHGCRVENDWARPFTDPPHNCFSPAAPPHEKFFSKDVSRSLKLKSSFLCNYFVIKQQIFFGVLQPAPFTGMLFFVRLFEGVCLQ